MKEGGFMLKKITKSVYTMPPYQETDRPALGVIVGENFSVAVDSGNSPAHASDFLQLVKKQDIAPVKFVLITHWHWDHVFGIKTMNLLTISHEETRQKIAHLKTLEWDDASLDQRVETGEEIEFCRDMIKREMPVRDELELAAPDIAFSQKMELDLGGITVIIEHVGGVHATDSSIIYVPEEKVMFLGDCVYQDFYSGAWSYDRNEFDLLVKKLKKYEADWYVPGHQEVKTAEEMGHFFEDISSIGKIVGEEGMLDKAVSKFIAARRADPDEEQLEYIHNFVKGNQKNSKSNES